MEERGRGWRREGRKVLHDQIVVRKMPHKKPQIKSEQFLTTAVDDGKRNKNRWRNHEDFAWNLWMTSSPNLHQLAILRIHPDHHAKRHEKARGFY